MLNQELISVIVPIYNVEKYLDRCVKSICEQSYRNLEIILVDDGSPDMCGAMCDTYSNHDSRILVVHKENGGLSDARNAGLNICSGTYVTFIDSDDYIEHDYIETLYSSLVESQADISIGDYFYETENGLTINSYLNSGKVRILDQKEAIGELCRLKLFSNSAWGKLYPTKFFSGIRYPKGKIYEDIPVTYRLILKASKIAFCEKPIYHYIYRLQAISKGSFRPQRLDALQFVRQMKYDIAQIYPEYTELLANREFEECIYIYKSLMQDLTYRKDYSKKLYIEAKKIVSKCNWKLMSKKMKIYAMALRCGKTVFDEVTLIENGLARKRAMRKMLEK
ncbi:glycosyltransferase family 2 protein [Faecalibacterium tardum]|uniref:Glycosyltransferase family 2 protein n=1 Tax=Faecalibacterium tardum TaxID=3133156 RepID=A0ABV1AVU9_9FIRM